MSHRTLQAGAALRGSRTAAAAPTPMLVPVPLLLLLLLLASLAQASVAQPASPLPDSSASTNSTDSSLLLELEPATGGNSSGSSGASSADGNSTGSGGASDADVQLLLAFKGSWENGAETLASWQEGISPCTWAGVTCNGRGYVVGMYLRSMGLRGTLPPNGWQLPSTLDVLALSHNRIRGTIPSTLELPPALTYFSLSGNRDLQGSIPPGWTLPPGLRDLYINNCSLTGSLPSTWVLPPSLDTLALAQNSLTGSIPSGSNGSDGSLASNAIWPSSLTDVLLFNNSLSGSLPLISGLRTTTFFVQPGNRLLCGEIPTGGAEYYSFSPMGPIQGPLAPCSPLSASPLPVQPSPSPSPPAASSNAGAIAGAVVGAVVGVVLAGLLGWWCWRRRRQRQQRGGGSGGAECLEKRSTDSETLGPEDSNGGAAHTPFAAYGTFSLPGEPSTPGWPAPEGVRVALNGSSAERPPATDRLLASLSTQRASTGASVGKGGVGTSAESQGSDRVRGWRPEVGDVRLWVIPFEELQIARPLGEGSFGKVYLAKWNQTPVAAKVLVERSSSASGSVLSLSSPALADLQQEASHMAGMRHPHVLGFMGLCLNPPTLVSEYCPRGALFDILQQARTTPAVARQLDWRKRLSLAIGGAAGMLYLHSRSPPIVHRDIKSPNLLVTQGWQAKVADFNLSRILEESAVASSAQAVTNPRWLAPEVLNGSTKGSKESDVFSFALVLYELLTWQLPWEEINNPWQVVGLVMDGGRPAIPADPGGLPGGTFAGVGAYISLMRRCWAQQPDERPTFADIVAELRELLPLAREEGGTPAAGRRASDAVQQGSEGLPAADAGPTAAPLPDKAEEAAAVAAADTVVAVAPPPSAPEQQCGEEEQQQLQQQQLQQQQEEEGAEGELGEQERLRSLSKHFVFVDAPH